MATRQHTNGLGSRHKWQASYSEFLTTFKGVPLAVRRQTAMAISLQSPKCGGTRKGACVAGHALRAAAHLVHNGRRVRGPRVAALVGMHQAREPEVVGPDLLGVGVLAHLQKEQRWQGSHRPQAHPGWAARKGRARISLGAVSLRTCKNRKKRWQGDHRAQAHPGWAARRVRAGPSSNGCHAKCMLSLKPLLQHETRQTTEATTGTG